MFSKLFKIKLNQKFILIILFFSFFPFYFSQAQVILTEIMYDLEGGDSGREWIEVTNTGSETVDLTGFKFFEANTNHGLTLISGSFSLNPNSSAIITDDQAKFLIDWPSFSGNLFDSTFSLSNTGENLALKNLNLEIIDEVTYSSDVGAAGDGQSLQKKNNLWSAAAPTPGSLNGSVEGGSSQSFTDSETETNNSNLGLTSSTSSDPSLSSSQNNKISASIIGPKIAFSKVAISLDSLVLDPNQTELLTGQFWWNFGDGLILEQSEKKKISHTYYYPGDYVVVLNYFKNSGTSLPDAESRLLIKVVPASIIISQVGEGADAFVELTNNSKYEINLAGWLLLAKTKSFIIPQNTIILPNRSIIFSPKITSFNAESQDNLKLFYPSLELADEYKKKETSQVKVEPDLVLGSNPIVLEVPPVKKEDLVEKKESKVSEPIPLATLEKSLESENKSLESENLNDQVSTGLTATALEALGEDKSTSSFWFYLIGVLGLTILGGSFLFSFRKTNSKTGPLSESAEIAKDIEIVDD